MVEVRRKTKSREPSFRYMLRTIAEMTRLSARASLERGFYTTDSYALNLHIVAEAVQPLHIRLAAKPCHLSFGVIAVSLLRGLQRLFPSQLSPKKLHGLPVAEGRKHTRGIAVLLKQLVRF